MQDYSISSYDHQAMLPYWNLVSAIMGGATTMRRAGQQYLPKFPNETADDYKFRCDNAKFTNIFRDIVENLASKPFAKEVTIDVGEDAEIPENVQAFIEDVDGRRSHLHNFAGQVFFNGLANAIDWILVDYPNSGDATKVLADQKKAGIRPYWIRIPAARVKAAFTDMIDGKEQFYHVRITEDVIDVVDGIEVLKERVRILDRARSGDATTGYTYGPPTWTVVESFKNNPTDQNSKSEWRIVSSGNISIGVIPLVPFITGRRIDGSWRFHPCLQDCADLQVELYQQESGLKYARELTAFPMLAGNGVAPAEDANGKPVSVPVGPKTVLYAPPNGEGEHGEWVFIEPGAASLKFLADEIKETKQELRELGRQPLTAQTGNLTVVTTAFAAEKANSVIQALALNLKDALENAFVYTKMWDKWTVEPNVVVDIDFGLDMGAENGPATLMDARRNGDLSRETLWDEFQRRGIIGDEFNPEVEAQRLLDEQPGDTEGDVASALGGAASDPQGDQAKAQKAQADQQTAAIQSAVQEVLAGIKEGLSDNA